MFTNTNFYTVLAILRDIQHINMTLFNFLTMSEASLMSIMIIADEFGDLVLDISINIIIDLSFVLVLVVVSHFC